MRKERLKGKDIILNIPKTVLQYLTKKGYNPQYGARPLKRLIQNEILTPVASMMISEGMISGGIVAVSVKNDKLSFVIKKRKGEKKVSLIKKEKIKVK